MNNFKDIYPYKTYFIQRYNNHISKITMSEYVFTYIGITIIIFIVCIFLVIFAPKSKNFFKKDELDLSQKDIFDILEDNSVLEDTMNNLGISIEEEYEEVQENENNLRWIPWPDKNIIKEEVSFLPIFMFSKLNETNLTKFKKLFDKISNTKCVRSIYFVKLAPGAKFNKHTGWKELTNLSLRYIYCFNAYSLDENQSGIWVNGECKKLSRGSTYVYDASKEHSIYNYTSNGAIYLMIDFKRPNDIPDGYSTYELGEEKIEEIQDLVSDEKNINCIDS